MKQVHCAVCGHLNYVYRQTCQACGSSLPQTQTVVIVNRQYEDAEQLMSWREWLDAERKRRHENQPA